MSIRTQLRTLATASMLALAIVIVPAGLAHAEASGRDVLKAGCQGAGYVWSDTQGCGNKPCTGWPYGNGRPGDSTSLGGSYHVYCDGFTGQWTEVGLVSPASPPRPAAPQTDGTLDPTGPTSSGTRAPRATTNSR